MNGRYQYQPSRFNATLNWKNHRDFGYGNYAGCYQQQYRRGFYYRPTGVPTQKFPIPEKSNDKSIESRPSTSTVAINKRKSHETDPIKSNEEVMRLKRLRKDTEDVIKDNGKKLQYKQLSLILKKKLKNTKSQLESLPFEKTDIIQQKEVLTQRQLSPQTVNDDSRLFLNGNEKSKTIWYEGDAGKWAGAPSLPDLQLGNEDFKNIGSGSLSKAHEELGMSSQENKASPEPFPQRLIQTYCRLTDENPHFSKHRKALVRKNDFEIKALPKRTRRNSEPSITNTSWSSGENLLEDLEDNSVLNENSVNRLELGRVNTTIKRLVEDSSTTSKFRHIKASLLKDYHSELSRQFCSERFGTDFKSYELSRSTTQNESLNDEILGEDNIMQLISDQINHLDEGFDGDASFDTLPTALMSPIQTMIFAPKRERRHSFSDKNNDYNNLRDATSHKLLHCSLTPLISNTNCNEITKIRSNNQAKSLENSCDIALNNKKSIQSENDEDGIVSLETFSSDNKGSSLYSKSKEVTDITIEQTTNLQEDIINLLKESDNNSRIRSNEEILLIEELKSKESRKKAIENRQKEIVEQLRKLKEMNNGITKI